MVGGCRNAEDEARVEGLRSLAEELGVSVSLIFVVQIQSETLTPPDWINAEKRPIRTERTAFGGAFVALESEHRDEYDGR